MLIHGVFVDIASWGVLLMGPSQIGKSELALELLKRGHRLIADDCVNISKTKDNKLFGTCPPLLQDFLAIRDIGIINIRKMFGAKAICKRKAIEIIINLTAHKQPQQPIQTLLDLTIPAWTLMTTQGRNLVTLIETIVSQQELLSSGYNAGIELETKHQQLLNNEYL